MNDAVTIPAVVLAAGASTRLGTPKQLEILGGETLLERTVRVARAAGCSPVIVVLGAEYSKVLGNSDLGDVVTVINDKWQEGMGSSVRLGVRTCGFVAKSAEGVVLMTCDQPTVTVRHLERLMKSREMTASRYAGRNGVPAYFPAKCFGELMALQGDKGARELLKNAGHEELEGGDLDVDTADDLERARKLFR
ncbi:MAG: nucleotidyltransferase family protein [Acidobacteriales bacterium]|nr:nucleotidyltransferase family protein [Terriglobales bacterium]